jgi:hypothetical protein
MNYHLQEVTYKQRSKIAALLHKPMSVLAQDCVNVWPDRVQLNQVLINSHKSISDASNLFVLNASGIQVSDNVSANAIMNGFIGRDHSACHYMKETVPGWGFLLSDAYISRISHRPSLTAIHLIQTDQSEILGYVGACFDLRNLPTMDTLYSESDHWRQIRGDPSIRRFLFQQARTESSMDRSIDQGLSILEELLTEHGIFQCVIHFSSSRATVWSIEDPFRYHILDQESLNDPDICLAYPKKKYSEQALIPPDSIWPILQTMRELRLQDETLYLRSTSINLFNGMLNLTFSCDGSHYMRYDDFLEKSLAFWFGENE